MASGDGAVFTFDTAPFQESMAKMERSLSKTASSMANIGKTITQSVTNAAHKAVSTVTRLTAGFLSVNAAMKAMPVVGTALDKMKDVLLRNLFWPLQKQILPLLQKMLDWVTSHRMLFIKWGEVIANVFRTAYALAQQVWDVFSKLANVAGTMLKDAFGVESLDEFINLMVMKMYVIMMFLGSVIEDVVGQVGPGLSKIVDAASDVITKIAGWAAEIAEALIDTGAVGAFFDMFGTFVAAVAGTAMANLEGIKNWFVEVVAVGKDGKNITSVMEKVTDLITKLGELTAAASRGFWSGFKASTEELMPVLDEIAKVLNTMIGDVGVGGVEEAFRRFGSFVGGTLLFILSGLGQALTVIVAMLDAMVTLLSGGDMKAMGNRMKGYWDSFENMGDSGVRAMVKAFKSDTGLEANVENAKTIMGSAKVEDAVITPSGQVIETAPEDYIFATKRPEALLGGGARGDIKVTFGNVNVTCTEGDAQVTGERFAMAFANEFADKIAQQLYMEGTV